MGGSEILPWQGHPQGFRKLHSSPWLLSALITKEEAQRAGRGQAGGRQVVNETVVFSTV